MLIIFSKIVCNFGATRHIENNAGIKFRYTLDYRYYINRHRLIKLFITGSGNE